MVEIDEMILMKVEILQEMDDIAWLSIPLMPAESVFIVIL